MFIPQLVTTRANELWTSGDSSMKFSDFISNGWAICIFLILILTLVCQSLLSMVCWFIFNFFLSDVDVGLIVSLLYILLIHLQVFVFDTEIGLPVSLSLFSRFRRFIRTFFFLFRHCWASLFSLDSSLSFALLLFSYSRLAINCFSFSSGISVQDFRFLLIGCVWFLLSLKGKCSVFGLMNILQIKFIISDKDTFNFKRNNPYL